MICQRICFVGVFSTTLAVTLTFRLPGLISSIAAGGGIRVSVCFDIEALLFRRSTSVCWVVFFLWLLLSLALVSKRPFGVELVGLGPGISGIVLLETLGPGRSGTVFEASEPVGGSDNIYLNTPTTLQLLIIVNLLISIAWLFLLAFSRVLLFISVFFFSASTAFFIRALVYGIGFPRAISHSSLKAVRRPSSATLGSSIYFSFLEVQRALSVAFL